MRQEEREAVLRQGVVRPLSPRERRELEGLEEDVRAGAQQGDPLRLRLRNFTPRSERYLASLGGPLPYMTRLREIESLTAAHEHELEARWRALAAEEPDGAAFARRWQRVAETESFHEVNDLIARHNRWYPAESRLPMDPRRGDYALVNGHDYRLAPLDAAWVLVRFPADLSRAAAP